MKRAVVGWIVVLGLVPGLGAAWAEPPLEPEGVLSGPVEEDVPLEVEQNPWAGGWYVVGRLAARDVLEGPAGLRLSYDGPSGPILLRGRGDERRLRLSGEGCELVAEVEGDEVVARFYGEGGERVERWRPAGAPELALYVNERTISGRALDMDVEITGTPQDVALVVYSDEPAYRRWGGVAHFEDLGRLPVGLHRVTWDGLDRRVPRRALAPGNYRIALEACVPIPATTREDVERAAPFQSAQRCEGSLIVDAELPAREVASVR